jgi:hypothetical protein
MQFKMERITSEATPYMPGYEFNPDGKLKLEGRSIPENVAIYYDPLIEFIDALNVDQVIFDINLEYFNTASSKKIMEMLRHLDRNMQIKNVRINWHYEEDDESSLETAEIYEECLPRVDFRFHEYAEVA